MSAVAKVVWLIESRIGDPTLSLEAMAEHAGVSRTHLSRIFPVATGRQLSSYQRGRCLSEAARRLANGAPDIFDGALDAGYGSHEAFTRVFRDLFGVTPDVVRRRRSLDQLELVEPLRMPTAPTTAPAPAVETRAAHPRHLRRRLLARIARAGPGAGHHLVQLRRVLRTRLRTIEGHRHGRDLGQAQGLSF